ncbi:MAG TPA: hypothetical protein VK612_11355, partial [Pyrinomonadaceae bacterium]|nr:hypothetical protein [Pyrinomonadaceae bacterium]
MYRPEKSFWQRIGIELQEFTFWLFRRFLFWIKSFIRWFESVARILAEESRVYILLIVISGLGALIWIYHDSLPISETKRQQLVDIASLVSFGSGAFVVLRALEVLLYN